MAASLGTAVSDLKHHEKRGAYQHETHETWGFHQHFGPVSLRNECRSNNTWGSILGWRKWSCKTRELAQGFRLVASIGNHGQIFRYFHYLLAVFCFFFVTFTTWMVISRGILHSHPGFSFWEDHEPYIYISIYYHGMGPWAHMVNHSGMSHVVPPLGWRWSPIPAQSGALGPTQAALLFPSKDHRWFCWVILK